MNNCPRPELTPRKLTPEQQRALLVQLHLCRTSQEWGARLLSNILPSNPDADPAVREKFRWRAWAMAPVKHLARCLAPLILRLASPLISRLLTKKWLKRWSPA